MRLPHHRESEDSGRLGAGQADSIYAEISGTVLPASGAGGVDDFRWRPRERFFLGSALAGLASLKCYS